MRIGSSSVIRFSKICNRCTFVDIDQDTGVKDGKEISLLEILKSYRQVSRNHTKLRKAIGDSPIFGMQYGVVNTGDIKIGDEIWAEVEE